MFDCGRGRHDRFRPTRPTIGRSWPLERFPKSANGSWQLAGWTWAVAGLAADAAASREADAGLWHRPSLESASLYRSEVPMTNIRKSGLEQNAVLSCMEVHPRPASPMKGVGVFFQ